MVADTVLATQGDQVLVQGDNIQSFKAGGTILAGAVVGYEDTGTSGQVIQMSQATNGACVGVALHDASANDYVAVACIGCVCYVYEGKGGTIDAGDYVVAASNVTGTISAVSDAAFTEGVGIALDDIAANSKGRVLIRPFAQYS